MGDMPLQLYEFLHVDHDQRCPKYTESIRRGANPLQTTDLDELYTELETLLGAANIRMRRLESEAKILTDWCDKKDRKAGGPEVVLEQHSNKRYRASFGEEKISKKQKIEEIVKPGVSKGKNKQNLSIELCENTTEDVEMYVSKPKTMYDAPNKFWSLVEPYCADLTMGDLNLLEEMMHTDNEELYHVTPLGRHYSQKWLEEDMLEEQKAGTKAFDKRNRSTSALGNNNSSNINNDNTTIMKKVQNVSESIEDHCSLGMLTQRLVSSLIDENIVTSFESDDFSQYRTEDNDDHKVTARSITITNTKSLESAIKDELFNIGLIDSISDEDYSDGESEDEVMSELKRHQNELRAISAHNKTMSDTLLCNAKQEMKRQEYKQRIKAMDAEVMDAFRKITSAKQKKRIITKKERDQAWKAVRDREALLKLLDASE